MAEAPWKFTGTEDLCRQKYLRQLTDNRNLTEEDIFFSLDSEDAEEWLDAHVKLEDEEDCALRWDALKSILDRGSPVAFSHRWDKGGHMMVASGYLEIGEQQWLVVNNPWPPGSGDRLLMPYDYYLRGPTGRHWRDYWQPGGEPITESGLWTTDRYPDGIAQTTNADWKAEREKAVAAARESLTAIRALEDIEALNDEENLMIIPASAGVEEAMLSLGEGRGKEIGLPLLTISLDDMKANGDVYIENLKRFGVAFADDHEGVAPQHLTGALFPVFRGDSFVSLIRVERRTSEWKVAAIGGSNLIHGFCLSSRSTLVPAAPRRGGKRVRRKCPNDEVTADTCTLNSAHFKGRFFVLEVPQCYQVFILAIPESEEPFVVPMFSQPELGFCQGARLTPEVLVKFLRKENGVCGSSLGG